MDNLDYLVTEGLLKNTGVLTLKGAANDEFFIYPKIIGRVKDCMGHTALRKRSSICI